VDKWVFGVGVGRLDDDCREVINFVVSYVVKVIRYMDLKNARASNTMISTTRSSGQNPVGREEARQAVKRTASLYNAIRLGQNHTFASYILRGASVAPNWRYGHFRVQPYGPGWQERKLIFAAPVLIHADQMQGELPAPKVDRADA
jgi:hypothetical protein